jgi:hypothetical protein
LFLKGAVKEKIELNEIQNLQTNIQIEQEYEAIKFNIQSKIQEIQ